MKTRFDFGRFRCAIFDLDGTLLNSTDVWAKVDIDFLGKRNIEVPEDFIRKIKTHNFATGSKYVIERFNLDEKPEDIAKEWFDMAVQAYADDIDLKPGAADFLENLRQKGYKICIATASDRELYEACLKEIRYLIILIILRRAMRLKEEKDFLMYMNLPQKNADLGRMNVLFLRMYMKLYAEQ